MFGYVTVSENQLSQEEYAIFSAYYCGVCKATGKTSSQLARLSLSYDITFLAIVLSAVTGQDNEIKKERCIAHPVRKRGCVKDDDTVAYAAAAGTVLAYLKLRDDWHDDRSIKALFGMIMLRHGYKKASRIVGGDMIKKQLKKLAELEKDRCASIDKTADCFAKILEWLFTPDFIDDDKTRRALAWFGYNLGRWIYIIDAYCDIEDDVRTGAYNPLKESGITDKSVCRGEIELSLTFTLENIASAFELIDFKRYKDIVGKMVYTSLRQKQNSLLQGQERIKNI